jgi:FMN phosphatase YigB (HAD superfamily)
MSGMNMRLVTQHNGVVDHPERDGYDAVLFDLSGTTIDDDYIRIGYAAVAQEMHRTWGIDEAVSAASIHPELRDQLIEWAHRPYFPMIDSMIAAFHTVVIAAGQRATDQQLRGLHATFWKYAIPAATITPGTFETLGRLRSACVRTGILSFADSEPFRALLEHTGLAGLTDVELCSQEAVSCKPDPKIFRDALAILGVAPERSLFVGDSIEADIVGANRVGMATVLLTNRPYAITAPNERRSLDRHHDRHPTYRITTITQAADLALRGSAARPPSSRTPDLTRP